MLEQVRRLFWPEGRLQSEPNIGVGRDRSRLATHEQSFREKRASPASRRAQRLRMCVNHELVRNRGRRTCIRLGRLVFQPHPPECPGAAWQRPGLAFAEWSKTACSMFHLRYTNNDNNIFYQVRRVRSILLTLLHITTQVGMPLWVRRPSSRLVALRGRETWGVVMCLRPGPLPWNSRRHRISRN